MRGRDLILKAGGFKMSLTAQVQALFAAGRVGGMWDMGDTATLFQDTAGSTPVTAVTQPIGMVLDKSQGLVRGVELISNGSFDTDTIWSKGTGWSITGGAATSVGANQFQALTQTTATISGKTYEVSFVVSRTSGSLLLRLGSGANKADISASGSYRYVVQADGGSIAFLSNATGFEFVGTIDNVSVKELPGNHATQPTAGLRPLFSARKNLLTKTEVFTDAAWGKLGVTVTANNATAPDGTLTASTITFPSGGGANQIYQPIAVTTTPVTQGVWLRSASTVSVDFGFYDSTFDMQSISVTSAWTYFTKTRASGLTGGDRRGIWIYPNVPATIEIWHPQVEVGSAATSYQRVDTASDYDTVGFPAFAQFDATDDALLFPAITFGGALNTFVAGKLTGGTVGVHLWRTADYGDGYWAAYQSGSATSPTGLKAGSPTYSNNGIAVSPQTRAQIYTLINGVDSVLESTGIVLSAETAIQFSGYPSAQFQGDAHRVLMISGTLTAAEKLLCRQWCAEGNGVTVV